MTETNESLPREGWVTNEGMATWVVRFQDPTGFSCQLLLESSSGKDVLSKGKAAITYLQESGCLPVPFTGQTVSIQPQSSKQEVPVEVKEEPNTSAFICLLHGVAMQKYTKGNHSWFAHRLENGKWCKGKWS